MAAIPDNSIDSIVTDPPYGLSFMGKKWDYDVPSVEIWAECLRVLKPGGHLLAFAGTRTQHRMAVRIEDAGFEIRDMIAWVYGSGFPKSLDVSKAIDKMDAAQEQGARRLRFTSWVRSTGITSRQIDEATGTNMGGHYITAASQPAIMTREHLEQCRHLLGDVPEWVEREADIRSVESRNFAEREVVGKARRVPDSKVTRPHFAAISGDGTASREYFDTAPATEAARQWAGWGTALKPALEPITVARKPLIGTVAENVLAHGTGALNVDGCRVGNNAGWSYPNGRGGSGWHGRESLSANLSEPMAATQGRWPANLIHDGSEEVVGLFPVTTSGALNAGHKQGAGSFGKVGGDYITGNYGNDSGSAARFFYCAKASKRDRNEGNNHPTVKPTDLMRYLCRLVTPPGGTVFDPFMGSGSTGKAAAIEGFSFIGAEMQKEYFDIAVARIGKKESKQQDLI
jgi:DNA modification methylase